MAKKPAPDAGASAAASAAESRKEALLDAAAKDSPVLTLIAKRLRAARKKVKRVEEIEAIKAQGREINTDQEEVLKGKAKNTGTIEELERLVPLLKEAVAEELSEKLAAKAKDIEETVTLAATAKAADEAKASAEAHAVDRAQAEAVAEELRDKIETAAREAAAEEVARAREKAEHDAKIVDLENQEQRSVEEAVLRLVQLFYFSKLFSSEGRPSSDFVHQMERDACLTYMSNGSNSASTLTHEDLDMLCAFGRLVSTRPATEMVSHEAALGRCKTLAMDWVHAAEIAVPQLQTTVNELVIKFERIVGSDYYSVKPEMRAPEASGPSSTFKQESGPAAAAAAAAQSRGPMTTAAGAPQAANALQQLLYNRPQQTTASEDHGPPNGFMQSNTAAYQINPQSNSSSFGGPNTTGGLNQAAATDYLLGSAPNGPTHQPPGFEPAAGINKAPHHQAANGNHYLGNVFQGAKFGGITKAELAPSLAAMSSQGSSGLPQFFAPSAAEVPKPPAPTDAPAPPTHNKQQEDVEGLIERKGPSAAAQPIRPRGQPNDTARGRGPPGRGRGPPARGDFAPRGSGGGGGRRGGFPPGRGGYRGRGSRDFVPAHFAQQQQQQPIPSAANPDL